MTITNTNDEVEFSLYFCEVVDTDEWQGVSVTSGSLFEGDVFVVPLYKGNGSMFIADSGGNPPLGLTVNVTGDITFDSDDGYFTITGDGTITIS